ncbi:MAG TPA: rod shape-determining protein RodA [Nitrospiraceae bacterium]|nr:rod shape-determining protein RodA [Nitrospiraceae bacterium]
MERRWLTNIPWSMSGLAVGIAIIGLFAVYSATFTSQGPSSLYYKQLLWIAAGIVVMFLAIIPDYHTIGRFAYSLYIVSIVLLVLVMVVGRAGMGAQRWLSLGPIAFQPSELAKLAVVLALARYFAEDPRQSYGLTDLAKPAILVMIPLVLVLRQPDLGTALMLLLAASIVIVIAGLRIQALMVVCIVAATLAASVVLVPPVKGKVWNSLKPYQQKRIKAFLNPESDPLGSGYHAHQSKIAVGSGRITGKGFLQGTQSQLAFLPERHTDFIFSVIAEEHGLFGTGFMLFLYLALLLLGIETAKNAKDKLGALMAGGIVAMLALYVFINIGMTVGVAPVVGVPLPLASYGGTSIITTFLAIGLLSNIQMRRYMLFY